MTPEEAPKCQRRRKNQRTNTDDAVHTVSTLITKSGEKRVVELRSVNSERNGSPLHIVMIVDVTESVMAQRKLEELVNLDDLTGLTSRRGLKSKLNKMPRDVDYEFFLIDIDRFKSVNDTYGHENGDALLRQIGVALEEIVPTGGIACRLGGEEFAVLRPTIQPYASLAFAHQLRQVLASVSVPGPYGQLSRTASIGATLLGRNEKLSHALTWSDHALREAKDNGRDSVVIVNDRFRKKIEADGKLITQHDLITAIDNREICKFSQHIFDARTGETVGYEALIRWVQKDGTVIAPHKFLGRFQNLVVNSEFSHIPRGLNCDLIKSLTADPKAFISFNTKLEALSFPGAAQQLMREFGVDVAQLRRRSIVLEISEASIHDRLDKERVLIEMDVLRDMGVKIALDDFGKAASNLYRLTNFPIDIVKIDRSLVERIVEDYRSRETLRAVARLAEALSFDVIAEGVETPAQRDLLLSLGIHTHQGFLYGHPMPVHKANAIRPPMSVFSQKALPVDIPVLQ